VDPALDAALDVAESTAAELEPAVVTSELAAPAVVEAVEVSFRPVFEPQAARNAVAAAADDTMKKRRRLI